MSKGKGAAEVAAAEPGSYYQGEAWRVETCNIELSMDTTAMQCINFEADELGNEHVREDALRAAKIHGIDLSHLSYESMIWVTRDKKTANKLYGYEGEDSAQRIDLPEKSIVLCDLGGDGVLVLIRAGA